MSNQDGLCNQRSTTANGAAVAELADDIADLVVLIPIRLKGFQYLPVTLRTYSIVENGTAVRHRLATCKKERYQYDDLDFEAPLSALDFDPANPAYAFHRY